MTSISTGSPSIQAWMVKKLFGSASRGLADQPTAVATSSPPPIAITSLSKVSQATTKAISDLGTRGPSSSADPFHTYLERQSKLDGKANATLLSNSLMSSKDVEAAMYGAGVPDPSSDGPKISFADIIARERGAIEDYKTDPATFQDPVERRAELDRDVEKTQFLDSVESAYKNHTLVFQNAKDVQGLNFSRSDVVGASSTVQFSSSSQNYDRNFYENRMNKDRSRMLDTGGGLTIYLTW